MQETNEQARRQAWALNVAARIREQWGYVDRGRVTFDKDNFDEQIALALEAALKALRFELSQFQALELAKFESLLVRSRDYAAELLEALEKQRAELAETADVRG